MSRFRAALAVGVVLALVVAVAVTVVLLRPTATVTTSGGLRVECAGIGEEPACAAWAEAVLADGPGIHTFDPDELEGVRLGRSVLGLWGECRAEYFLGRFGDDVVAQEQVPCPGE
jgi:hypothetical protein